MAGAYVEAELRSPSWPVLCHESDMSDEHPVKLVVTDDLQRSRLTVFFRLALSVPHLVWMALWWALTMALWPIAWLLTLILGRLPLWLHRFYSAYIRYRAHVTAFITIVGGPFPGFVGAPGTYPIDIVLPERGRQSRWKTLFRPVLVVLTLSFWIVGEICAIFGWVVGTVTGRSSRGLRDLGAFAVGYRSQVRAYLLFVTDRFPEADPVAMLAGLEPPPPQPVSIAEDDGGLQRSRLLVFFRFALLIPHIVWIALWGVAAYLALIVQWFITLVAGRPNAGIHRFLSRYVRQVFHLMAFAALVANPFPGFMGRPGSYPIDLELPQPGRQSRWKTFFRLILAYPSLYLASAVTGVVYLCSILSWFAALATGRSPRGLRAFSAYAARYYAMTLAYSFLLTDVYPLASPLEGRAGVPVEPLVTPAVPTVSPLFSRPLPEAP